MAKKAQTVYVCNECGYESPKWMGQCICGAWNSFVEERAPAAQSKGAPLPGVPARASRPVRLSEVGSIERDRIDTGIDELNRVLGGGIVKGSLTLIAGEPGIGKSTLILQTAISVAGAGGGSVVLYVTGEESEAQIRMRADRLSSDLPDGLMIMSETNTGDILAETAAIRPAFLIIDSIQTMYSEALDSSPGSVSQVRACASELMRTAKTLDIPVFIVAHVTKTGELAGPKIIEHLVDVVLQFTGERDHDLRILRSNKNRFGTTSEIGAFEMRGTGLAEVKDISGSLLDGAGAGSGAAEGAACAAVCEGNRPLLFEIQALTASTGQSFPRRTPLGVDLARLNMIIAVLERKAKVNLFTRDVYVNVAGGLRPDGTSADLAVALAICSSAEGFAIPRNLLAAGEIGLTGELRPVRGADKIVREAEKLGFSTVILPQRNAASLQRAAGITVIPAGSLADAIGAVRTLTAPTAR
jgi:DNA repair protein RadA/Sms